MLLKHYTLLAIVSTLPLASAQSLIPFQVFTDNKCNVPSTTATNVSLPLDTCITTVGMQSYSHNTIPCAGGGATSVQTFVYSDSKCVKRWYLSSGSYGSNCFGAWTAGNAYGSIILTCKEEPVIGTAATTINVGPVATGAASSSSTSSSTSSSGSSSGSSGSKSTSGDNDSCAGFSCLSTGERIGIIIALAVGIPPIFIPIMIYLKKKKQKTENTNTITTNNGGRGWQEPKTGSWPIFQSPASPHAPPLMHQQVYPQHNIEWHNSNSWNHRPYPPY